LNLANDVIQTGKKKGDAFSAEFEKVLPGAFENTFQYNTLIRFVGEDLKKHVRRLVAIWRERKIFSAQFLNLLEKKAKLEQNIEKSKVQERKLSTPVIHGQVILILISSNLFYLHWIY
jgi:hypothetical protein